MKKGMALMMAAVMAAGLLTGCWGNPADQKDAAGDTAGSGTTKAQAESPADNPGGTLKIAVNSESVHTMLNFDLTGAGVDYYYSWPVYESLFRPNAQGTVDPWLLEDYSYDPEALTYTFHVRKGVTFADGTVLDAEAVKWNLDHYLEVGAKVEALLSSIESVEVIDEYTVQLNLNQWSSILPYAFSRECGYMFSPTFFEEHGEEYCKEHPCGTGPYELTEWNYDVSKVFTRRDDYWGGEVKLDSIEYIIYTDPLVSSAALQSGEVDAILALSAESADALTASGYEIKTCAVKSHSYLLCFNSLDQKGGDPTGNLLVRQAICHAIDADALVSAVWGNYGSVRNQFGVGGHYYSDTVQGYEYNPEKAKELLAQAGYADGFDISLKTEDSSALKNAATIIQSYLAQVGIRVELTILSGADANSAESGWGEGMWLHGSSVYVSVPMQMASMFRQNLSGHVLGLNNLLRPDDVEEALAASVMAKNEEEAVGSVGEANRLLSDEYCIVYNLAEVATLFVVNDYVKDSGIGEIFYSVADLGNAWLDR